MGADSAAHYRGRTHAGFKRAQQELTRIGADWRLMLPVQPLKGRYQRPDLRNHRKLLVVDGRVAFVGSLNLIDPGYETAKNARRGLRWRDLLARAEGPVVQEVEALFATDWFSETGRLLPVARVQVDEDPATLLAQIAPSGPAWNQWSVSGAIVCWSPASRRISCQTLKTPSDGGRADGCAAG